MRCQIRLDNVLAGVEAWDVGIKSGEIPDLFH